MRAILVAILAILGIALVAVQALSVAQVGEMPPFGAHPIDATQRVVTWIHRRPPARDCTPATGTIGTARRPNSA